MQTKLSQKIGQRLALTPQLTQSLKILSMNAIELDTYIDECLVSNPVLEAAERPLDENGNEAEAVAREVEAQAEWRESGDDRWETMYTQSTPFGSPDMRDQQWRDEQSLTQSLHEQIDRQPMPDDIRGISHALIGMLDEDGYLRMELEEAAADLGCSVEAVQQALCEVVHQLDPPGIGARDLAECLLLQLDDDNACDVLARKMLLDFPEALFGSDAELAGLMECDELAVVEARARLRRLDPYPGHGLRGEQTAYIRPEIIFRRMPDGHIQIDVPDYGWRGMHISSRWQEHAWQGADRKFIDNATREAKWLLQALEQRHETLQKVATCLAVRQRAFLEYGPLGLKPLTLQDVAAEVGLHESTISRVTNGKYAETPIGMIEMRRFFSAGLATRDGGSISVGRVQFRVKALIAAEPVGRPISDQAIADRLSDEGIEIARRTVAKYRESLGIPPTSQRRKEAGTMRHIRR